MLGVLPLRLQAGDVILFNTTFISGNATKLLTWSNWDHMAMVVETPKKKLKLFEAIPDGVNLFSINSRLEYYLELSSVGIRRLEVARNQEMIDSLYQFSQEVLGRPYKHVSNLNEFVKALNYSNQVENLESIFCSELVAAAFKRMKLLPNDVCSNNFLPRDFEGNGVVKLVRGKLGKLKTFSQRKATPDIQLP
jgi:uncharacterized protein YycO